MNTKSFEDLWVACEESCKDLTLDEKVISILDELQAKLNLYKVIEFKKEIPKTELKIMKERVLGEMLFTITKLSFKDNINVFQALLIALNNKK